MPRRLITSEICYNEKFASLPDGARLLFIGCIINADDDGRLKASPAYLRAHIFPYDINKDITQVKEWRDLCNTLGLLRVYSVNGSEYLELPGWLEHQSIRRDRYQPSKLPPHDNLSPTIVLPTDNQSATKKQPNDNHPTTEYNISKGNISKGNNIYSLWNEQKIITHKKLTDDIERAIINASKDNTEGEICQAIKNYAEILKDDKYFFKYSWTLKDFLKRGLTKFLDLEVARKNYLKDKKDGANRQNPRPLPTKYTDPSEL